MKAEIFALVVIFTVKTWQYPFNGTCPSLDECFNPDLTFSRDQFLGVWFLYANIRLPFQEDQKCTFINNIGTKNVNEYISYKYEFSNITNDRRVSSGPFILSPPNHADLSYTNLKFPLPFHVVDSTIDFYTLLTCQECGFYSKEGTGFHAYAFTRHQFPSRDIQEQIMASYERCGIPKEALIVQQQNNCDFC